MHLGVKMSNNSVYLTTSWQVKKKSVNGLKVCWFFFFQENWDCILKCRSSCVVCHQEDTERSQNYHTAGRRYEGTCSQLKCTTMKNYYTSLDANIWQRSSTGLWSELLRYTLSLKPLWKRKQFPNIVKNSTKWMTCVLYRLKTGLHMCCDWIPKSYIPLSSLSNISNHSQVHVCTNICPSERHVSCLWVRHGKKHHAMELNKVKAGARVYDSSPWQLLCR